MSDWEPHDSIRSMFESIGNNSLAEVDKPFKLAVLDHLRKPPHNWSDAGAKAVLLAYAAFTLGYETALEPSKGVGDVEPSAALLGALDEKL